MKKRLFFLVLILGIIFLIFFVIKEIYSLNAYYKINWKISIRIPEPNDIEKIYIDSGIGDSTKITVWQYDNEDDILYLKNSDYFKKNDYDLEQIFEMNVLSNTFFKDKKIFDKINIDDILNSNNYYAYFYENKEFEGKLYLNFSLLILDVEKRIVYEICQLW